MRPPTAPVGLPGGLTLGRTAVLGILNVTPDSFSDGGRYLDRSNAISHAEHLYAEGADIIDVGGESTRPGAERVDEETEIGRVVPVIAALTSSGIPTTVDTMRSGVARAAVAAGCAGINDVSGGLADPRMAATAADLGCPWILMHWRAHSRTMGDFAVYADVVAEVSSELSARVDAAVSAGVRTDRLVVDPGLGFAKTAVHNWTLLAHLDALQALGLPVLVGASRKSFLGLLLADHAGEARPPAERENATTAVSALSAAAGVWAIRTHDVGPTLDAILVAAAWSAAGEEQG